MSSTKTLQMYANVTGCRSDMVMRAMEITNTTDHVPKFLECLHAMKFEKVHYLIFGIQEKDTQYGSWQSRYTYVYFKVKDLQVIKSKIENYKKLAADYILMGESHITNLSLVEQFAYQDPPTYYHQEYRLNLATPEQTNLIYQIPDSPKSFFKCSSPSGQPQKNYEFFASEDDVLSLVDIISLEYKNCLTYMDLYFELEAGRQGPHGTKWYLHTNHCEILRVLTSFLTGLFPDPDSDSD